MSLLYRLLFLLLLFSSPAFAYSGPKGLYILEYPVNMPNAELISETGSTFSILEDKKDLTILIFWSQTCAPCLRELKALENFYQKAAKDNISVKLVAPASEFKNNAEERKFLKKYGAPTIPFYNDPENKLSLSLGIGSTPYTVIMDKSGKKVATIQGEANWNSDKLYKMIKKLIK